MQLLQLQHYILALLTASASAAQPPAAQPPVPCSPATSIMTTTRALLDLVGKYGTSELTLGMLFSSGTNATHFMQDYTYNANTRCRVKSSGTMKIYTCSDAKTARNSSAPLGTAASDETSLPRECSWEVRVSIKRKHNGAKRLWVSSIYNEHSDLCTSTAKPTQRQLSELATFRAAVQGNRKVKRKAVVSMLQSRDMINLQFSRSMFHRAKDDIIASADGEWKESFRRLPLVLANIRDSNPGTTVKLDVDQRQRFLRGFIAFGVHVQCQPGLLPMLGFDGAHSKHPKYNGVVLSLIGRDGNNNNITMASALVNVENESNILWFLEMCHVAGIRLSDGPTFCDRGKIIGAVPQLYQRTGVLMKLRYCTLHIIRNMRKKFKQSGKPFENAIWAIQGADTHDKYAKALRKMNSDYGGDAVKYLQEIGPVAWTVHANMSTYITSIDAGNNLDCLVGDHSPEVPLANSPSRDTTISTGRCDCCSGDREADGLFVDEAGTQAVSISEDIDNINDECDCCQFSEAQAVPMFKWRTSNFVESDNSALIENGVRESDPCSSFYKLTEDAMKKLCERRDAVEKWRKSSSDLTPYAKKLWVKEKERVGAYRVVRSNNIVSYVSHPGRSTHPREVNVMLPSCTCATFDQMRMACRHIFAALRDRGMEKNFVNAFHPAYLVKTYATTFADKSIALPVSDAPPGEHVVLPSPYYKQAGRHVTRRIASCGETGTKSTYVCRTCRERGHNRRTCRRHGNECDEANPDLIPCSFQLPYVHPCSETSASPIAVTSTENAVVQTALDVIYTTIEDGNTVQEELVSEEPAGELRNTADPEPVVHDEFVPVRGTVLHENQNASSSTTTRMSMQFLLD